MGNGTFSALDMTTYCGLVELGLVAVGDALSGGAGSS